MPGGCIQCIGTNCIETVKVNGSLNAAYSIIEVVINGDQTVTAGKHTVYRPNAKRCEVQRPSGIRRDEQLNRDKIMRNTRITSSKLLALQAWPATLHLPLIDDFVKDIRCHVWSLQLVTENALYFLVGEGDSMLREGKRVHICTQRSLGYHRV
jgi:hypothetical protein